MWGRNERKIELSNVIEFYILFALTCKETGQSCILVE